MKKAPTGCERFRLEHPIAVGEDGVLHVDPRKQKKECSGKRSVLMKVLRVRPNALPPPGRKVTTDRGGKQGPQGPVKNMSKTYKEDGVLMLNSRSMEKSMLAMARGNYGYGRWEADYWFIGPEQGMGPHENHDLSLRVQAWLDLGARALNDCRKFHCRIGEIRWHCKKPKVQLQRTWRPLLLLLMTFLDEHADNESLRNYQRDRWGSLEGETCVIELSGLAAPSLRESKETGKYLSERIEHICAKIRENRPKLVVMYGREQMASWNTIGRATVGREFPPEGTVLGQLPKTNILKHAATILLCTPAPSRPIWNGTKYLGNEYWRGLGNNLRDLATK